MKALSIALLAIMIFTAQPLYADTVEVLRVTTVTFVQYEDGLHYAQCVVGCEGFYLIAPPEILYRGFANQYDAIEHYLRLNAIYSGTTFVPLPPVMRG